jgi:flagellin-like hook-associated protein FlgL
MAWQAIEGGELDLVILDLNLPQLDGLSDTAPFSVDSNSPLGIQYDGNGNSFAIGANYSVPVNVPGARCFNSPATTCRALLQQLVTALRGGDTTATGTATNQRQQALDYVTQQRAFYGNVTNQTNTQETFLQNESVNIKSEEDSLVGVDLATAATNLTPAQTATGATMV